MTCQGCEGRHESDSRQLETKIKEAIKYAQDKSKAVGIYKDEQGKYQFIELSIATGFPILQIVSQYTRIAPK